MPIKFGEPEPIEWSVWAALKVFIGFSPLVALFILVIWSIIAGKEAPSKVRDGSVKKPRKTSSRSSKKTKGSK
jgi:hypothetical protein